MSAALRARVQRSNAGLAWLPLGWLLWALMGCAAESVHHEEAFVFGTRVDVSIWGVPKAQAQSASAAVLQEFDRLHRSYHAWEPSELSRLNAAIARGESVSVSTELAAMLREAQTLSAQSDALFNPAIGGLIKLWGFHSDQFAARLPAADELARLLAAKPSLADLDFNGQQLSSRQRAVQIDLGGFAKGWALDRAVSILRQRGVRNALVNIGGNLIALGSKGELPWRVGIQDPRRPGALASLNLKDGEAIGTSGDYQRYFELDGLRYCHLIDPRSGKPAQATRSLSVLVTARARAGTLSDAASKPAFIDAAHWRERLAAYGIAHALRVDAKGRIEVSAALAKRLEFAPGLHADAIVD